MIDCSKIAVLAVQEGIASLYDNATYGSDNKTYSLTYFFKDFKTMIRLK